MSNSINDGGPAFPSDLLINGSVTARKPYDGMSLRDWFAGQALPPIMVLCAADTRLKNETHAQMFARKAWDAADAMIAAREVKP